MTHPVSIRDAAYYYVGVVLYGIDGSRAKIKDVIDKINKIFLEHNPEGWQTTNAQKRAPDGGFTVSALRRIGHAPPPAAPGRWTMKPTFRVGDDADELVLIRNPRVDIPSAVPLVDTDTRGDDDDDDDDAAADSGDAAAGGEGEDDDDMSDIDE